MRQNIKRRKACLLRHGEESACSPIYGTKLGGSGYIKTQLSLYPIY